MALEVPMRFARGFSPGRLLRVLYSPKRAFTEARSHPTQLDWIVPAAGFWCIGIIAVVAVPAAIVTATPDAGVGVDDLIAALKMIGEFLAQLLITATTFVFSTVVSISIKVVYLLVVFNVFLGRDIRFKCALIVLGYTMVLDSLEIVSIAVAMVIDSTFTPDTTLSPLIPDHWKHTAAGSILGAADLKDLWQSFLFETGTTVMAGEQNRRWVVVVALWAIWTAARAYDLELTF